MSSGTVSLLIILKPRNSNNTAKHVILAETPTEGSTTPTQTLPEIPTPNATNLLSETAVKELESQIGRPLDETGLIDLTALAQSTPVVVEQLKLAVKGGMSGGNVAPLMLLEKKADQYELEMLKLKLTGLQEGKQVPTALRICDYEVLQKDKGNDSTVQAACIMYEWLQIEGKI